MKPRLIARFTYLLATALMCAVVVAGPAAAQNPESCSTDGFTGYSYTTTNDGTNTTLHFTFYNLTPQFSMYVNIGEIFFSGLPAPVGTPTSPSGWEFKAIGPKLFYATTSNPWWKTPPAIKPGDTLSGFNYTIPGLGVRPSIPLAQHTRRKVEYFWQTGMDELVGCRSSLYEQDISALQPGPTASDASVNA